MIEWFSSFPFELKIRNFQTITQTSTHTHKHRPFVLCVCLHSFTLTNRFDIRAQMLEEPPLNYIGPIKNGEHIHNISPNTYKYNFLFGYIESYNLRVIMS